MDSEQPTHSCGHLLKASFTFCPGCGSQITKSMRDENEIKAMLEDCSRATEGSGNMVTFLSLMLVQETLKWVLGNHTTPKKLLEATIKKENQGPQ